MREAPLGPDRAVSDRSEDAFDRVGRAQMHPVLGGEVVEGQQVVLILGQAGDRRRVWPNGRSECYAVCPGIPDLAERDRQDAMPRGLYRRLHDDGVLLVDEGLRVSRPATLIDHLVSVGISPEVIYCDRFALGTLKDAVAGRWPIVDRVARWSEATEDISGFRRLVADGPLSVTEECRALARVGLSQAVVHSDDQGSVRLAKRRHGRSRDDVAAAGVLTAGALARMLAQRPPRPRWRYRGIAG